MKYYLYTFDELIGHCGYTTVTVEKNKYLCFFDICENIEKGYDITNLEGVTFALGEEIFGCCEDIPYEDGELRVCKVPYIQLRGVGYASEKTLTRYRPVEGEVATYIKTVVYATTGGVCMVYENPVKN